MGTKEKSKLWAKAKDYGLDEKFDLKWRSTTEDELREFINEHEKQPIEEDLPGEQEEEQDEEEEEILENEEDEEDEEVLEEIPEEPEFVPSTRPVEVEEIKKSTPAPVASKPVVPKPVIPATPTAPIKKPKKKAKKKAKKVSRALPLRRYFPKNSNIGK